MELAIFLLLLSSSIHFTSSTTSSTSLGNYTDMISLLAFKSLITQGPSAAMSSWNETNHFCNWNGVACSKNKRHPDRVTSLYLNSSGLAGFISPSIANLTFLRNLDLSNNSLHGTIPPEIGKLRRLQLLDLSNNSFHGLIPINLTYCSDLMMLDLTRNTLSGKIPIEFGSLTKLGFLGLSNNILTGSLPSSIGNLSSLYHIALRTNQLEGSIPPEIGRLHSLQYLRVSNNKLSGLVPSTLFNLSSLYFFGLAFNQLWGSLPPTMGTTLPNLQTILLGVNQFEGRIPSSLPNASRLSFIDLSRNKLNGMVPPNLGSLASLSQLNLEQNQLETSYSLGWEFLTSLANCSQLNALSLFQNNLSGELPKSIGNLSTHLQNLFLDGNTISGSIPSEIGNLVNLMELGLGSNLLTGVIPKSIGKLQRLQLLNLTQSRLIGNIPSSLGYLTQLIYLNLSGNNLDGRIPPSLGNLQKLEELDLENNNFNGTIPNEIFSLSSLRKCVLSYNSLVSSIPSEVSSMQSLGELSVSHNKLTGEIPSTLGGCQLLVALDFSKNILKEDIPSPFVNLKGLEFIDFSQNNMSGPIPAFLQSLSLTYLNLSFNHFEGQVPMKGIFKNATATSLQGNDELCGGIPEFHLSSCPSKPIERRAMSKLLKVVIAAASSILFCLLLFTAIVYINLRAKPRTENSTFSSSVDQYLRASYEELVKATDGFASVNLLGTGSSGSVYKGTLDHGNTTVAVKVFNLEEGGASKSFIDECEALRNIRHRNLIRIVTSCSSVDSKGNDFKALVFEFMPNGDLDTWLHSKLNGHNRSEIRSLSLVQRLNIAIDVADALDYLHHDCQTPTIHCDLKPSNILLDDDMVAHVGDFGLARLLPELSTPLQAASYSTRIRGTFGYVAPEYGAGGQVSTSGDSYSYGILLLEMFTGIRPVSDMFRDGHNLHKYVEMAFPGGVMKIIDPLLLLQQEGGEDFRREETDSQARIQECIESIMRVGLCCSKESPKKRMNMRSAATEMRAMRNAYAGAGVYRHQENSASELH